MTLTEFLLARIAEDEAAAHGAYGVGSEHEDDPHWRAHRQPSLIPGHIARWQVVSVRECDEDPGFPAERITELMIGGGDEEERPAAEFIARHDPARALAECEAKRQVVHEWQTFGKLADPSVQPSTDEEFCVRAAAVGIRQGLARALSHLATPYADHPDYDEAWRP